MTVRRQLVNFGRTTTDFRIGCGAFAELSRLLAHVVGAPKRALLVLEDPVDEAVRVEVERALIDTGFQVFTCSRAAAQVTRVEDAVLLFAEFERSALTADDLVVAVGGFELCSAVAFCSGMWCQGVSSVAIPLTLDAMARVAISMAPLGYGEATEMISVQPRWDMVVCELDLVIGKDPETLGPGYVELLSSALAESKRAWEQFGGLVEGMVAGQERAFADALCRAQTARSMSIRSANPSSRHAVEYGVITARALRSCLDGSYPWYRLLAEGMRFEARLAHDVCGLDVDVVFDQDDLFEDLGVEELTFELEADRFVEALKRERYRRSNRFMLALPRFAGSIRLANIDDDLLMRHAEAYLASRVQTEEE